MFQVGSSLKSKYPLTADIGNSKYLKGARNEMLDNLNAYNMQNSITLPKRPNVDSAANSLMVGVSHTCIDGTKPHIAATTEE